MHIASKVIIDTVGLISTIFVTVFLLLPLFFVLIFIFQSYSAFCGFNWTFYVLDWQNVLFRFSIRCDSQAPGGKTTKVWAPLKTNTCGIFNSQTVPPPVYPDSHTEPPCISVTVQIVLSWLISLRSFSLWVCALLWSYSLYLLGFCSLGGSSLQCDLTSLVEVDFSAFYLV